MKSGYEKFFAAARASKDSVTEDPAKKSSKMEGFGNLPKGHTKSSHEARGRGPTQARGTGPAQVQVRRRSRSPSMSSVLFLVLISAGLGWWTVDPELPEKLSRMVEVRLFGSAVAETKVEDEKTKGAESAGGKEKNAEKAAQTKGDEKAGTKEDGKEAASEDTSHLEKLRIRSRELDQREKELTELEEELHKQKLEIEARIRQLENLRAQISGVLKERMEVDQEKVTRLVETYSNMKPKQAAEIIAGLDEDLAVEVMGKMKKKNAAEIMNLLEAGKARALSEKYAGFKKR